jgi:hypothetical protein
LSVQILPRRNHRADKLIQSLIHYLNPRREVNHCSASSSPSRLALSSCVIPANGGEGNQRVEFALLLSPSRRSLGVAIASTDHIYSYRRFSAEGIYDPKPKTSHTISIVISRPKVSQTNRNVPRYYFSRWNFQREQMLLCFLIIEASLDTRGVFLMPIYHPGTQKKPKRYPVFLL